MIEFELSGHHYRAETPNARAQLHIIRRLAPFTSVMVGSQGNLNAMAHTLARMPQEDVDYILDECLKVTTRKSGEGYAAVFTAQGGLHFQDLNGVDQFEIARKVIREFQDPFFAMLADVTK